VFDLIEDNPPGTTSPAACIECTDALVAALENALRGPLDEIEAAMDATWSSSTPLPTGTHVWIEHVYRRHWWQFWKPRNTVELCVVEREWPDQP
jgi:hypothetical protein